MVDGQWPWLITRLVIPVCTGTITYWRYRYTYSLKEKTNMTMMRSDPLEEIPIAAGPFGDPDNFVRYALDHERDVINHQA